MGKTPSQTGNAVSMLLMRICQSVPMFDKYCDLIVTLCSILGALFDYFVSPSLRCVPQSIERASLDWVRVLIDLSVCRTILSIA